MYLGPHARNEANLCEKDRSLSYVVAAVEQVGLGARGEAEVHLEERLAC